jgi:hypothetical protein
MGNVFIDALLANCFHVRFLLGLFFEPEDGGDIFLRDVGSYSAEYTALYPRRSELFIFISFIDPHSFSETYVGSVEYCLGI